MKKRVQGIILGVLIGAILTSGVGLSKQITETAELYFNNIKIYLDGQEIIPKDANGNVVEPFTMNGTTYLPVRAISNAFGKAVEWDEDTQSVYIGDREEEINIENCTLIEDDLVTISPVKDNKKAIYTLTTDDGFRYTNYVFLNEKLRELGLRATIGIVPASVRTNDVSGKNMISWEELSEIVNDGDVWGVANHTMAHKQGNFPILTAEELEIEIDGARAILKEKFPDKKIVGLYTPGGRTSDLIRSKAMEEHLCLRGAGGGTNKLPMTESGMYSLKCYAVGEFAVGDSETMNSWIDDAIKNGEWVVEMWHGIGDSDAASWKGNVGEKAATEHLEYVASKMDDVWVTTLDEASIYAMHRLKAKLYLVSQNDDEIKFILTDELDGDIFDSELTLNVKVPNGWEKCTAYQNSKALESQINGDGTVGINARSDGGVITISRK